jgi:hypothetical protein
MSLVSSALPVTSLISTPSAKCRLDLVAESARFPFAVAPFMERNGYGVPLSPEDHRLAKLVDRARRGRLPITADIRFELVKFLKSPGPRSYNSRRKGTVAAPGDALPPNAPGGPPHGAPEARPTQELAGGSPT